MIDKKCYKIDTSSRKLHSTPRIWFSLLGENPILLYSVETKNDILSTLKFKEDI